MIWSNYYVPMQPAMQEFKQLTGIGVGSIQDISIFDAPQRAMAEALSRSPQFDFFHIDSNMIPSLASAGLLEPLDEYMKKANFKIDAVGDYANFMTYKGNTYGIITDGNVHIQYLRKDLIENPDNQKRFADKHGKKLEFPQTWEDEFQIQQFFHNPEKDLYGSGSLRNRANGATWWYMMFYSAGGFPFDDDMNPTLNNAAGNYAVETYLKEKKVGASGIVRLGHAADDPAHRQRQGRVLPVLGRHRAAQREQGEVADRRQVALRPGAGLRQVRAAHSPLDLVAARRRAGQQVQPAQGAGRLSRAVVGDAEELDADRVRQGQHLP